MAMTQAAAAEMPAELAVVAESIEHLPREGVFVLRAFEGRRAPTTTVEGTVELYGRELAWKLEVPDKLEYQGLLVFMSGFLATMETSLPFGDASAQAGYPTLVFAPARHDEKSILERVNDPQELHVEALVAVDGALRRGNQLRQRFAPSSNRIDPDKKLLVPHSMGDLAANEYAVQHIDEIDKVIHIATVGFGSPAILELLTNLPRGVWPATKHELGRIATSGNIELSWSNYMRFLHHVFDEPTQTISEGLSCLTRNERQKVAQLREKGKLAGYLALQYDILVRPNKRTAQYVDDYRVMPNAGHAAPQVKPYATMVEVSAMHRRLETAQRRSATISDLVDF